MLLNTSPPGISIPIYTQSIRPVIAPWCYLRLWRVIFKLIWVSMPDNALHFSSGHKQGNDTLRFLSNEELNILLQKIPAMYLRHLWAKVAGWWWWWWRSVAFESFGGRQELYGWAVPSCFLWPFKHPPPLPDVKFQTFFILSKTGNVSKTPISSALRTFPNLFLEIWRKLKWCKEQIDDDFCSLAVHCGAVWVCLIAPGDVWSQQIWTHWALVVQHRYNKIVAV